MTMTGMKRSTGSFDALWGRSRCCVEYGQCAKELFRRASGHMGKYVAARQCTHPALIEYACIQADKAGGCRDQQEPVGAKGMHTCP